MDSQACVMSTKCLQVGCCPTCLQQDHGGCFGSQTAPEQQQQQLLIPVTQPKEPYAHIGAYMLYMKLRPYMPMAHQSLLHGYLGQHPKQEQPDSAGVASAT